MRGVFMKKISLTIITIVSIFLGMSSAQPMSKPIIEPFQYERDLPAIQAILNDYPDLTAESKGFSAGATEQYITGPEYKTEVLRLNNQTIGFVNYCEHNISYLKSYGPYGVLHLIGIEKKYQGKGYGKMLVQRAVEGLRALKAPGVLLMVKANNTTARILYETEGFSCPLADKIAQLPPETQTMLASMNLPYTKDF